MQRETWRLIINSKRFYVRTFRFAESALIVMIGFNILLGIGTFYVYTHIPDRQFYATNGEVPPVELTAMDTANATSVPLLAADRDIDDDRKVIPR